ncbi:MAG: UDP-N-acetylmuramoyl-tripeptide--D-alanyl-D-alanine ligase [Gammaproteobacteria bacterium]|nr:UDP-N-acetylmuramoyl-tripeptide--D-alanyl-D-alanine ligase [Gammaproteobacteria bacterium]
MMISELATVFGAKLTVADKEILSVSTDTRTILPGALFVAINGEKFDAHDYLDLAAEKGAVAALVERDVETNLPIIRVKDSRLALGQLASYWRQQQAVKVVGLTGSNGKTTVKEMLSCILSEEGPVLATDGNYNNDIGLPLTLLRIRPEHEYAVIEMGANHIGEIAYLTQLTRPDVALLNNAAPAHLEGFGSMQGVADAKGEIFSGLGAKGVAVINRDDQYSDYWSSLCDQQRKIFFGLDAAADVSTSSDESHYDGRFMLRVNAEETEVRLAVLGYHNLKNALAASAAATAIGVGMSSIKKGLEKFKGVKGRLQVNAVAIDSVVIDDSYNANPASVKAAIDVLAGLNKVSVLVLGDMGELGEDAVKLHSEIGLYAKQKNINSVMTFGELSGFAAESFGENGYSYNDKKALIKDLKKQLEHSIAVLVKGSRSMRMEEVVAALTDNTGLGAASCY